MTAPIYAIGDIHGHSDRLDRALELIRADGGPEAEVIFLGDLVDRGPDSRGVIERILQGRAAGRPWRVLLGNHDRLFLRCACDGILHDPRIRSGISYLHPRIGGAATFASYGVADALTRPEADILAELRAAVPAAHLRLIEDAATHIERGDLLFVHAGILPGVPLGAQTEDDLIWIRDPFHAETRPHPWLIVHGHTALDEPTHFGNRIDLDGGAGYGRPLHPAVLEGRKCWLLKDRGREPLEP